jgi:transposase
MGCAHSLHGQRTWTNGSRQCVRPTLAAILLRIVPERGALNATVISAAVGDVGTLGKARDFAAWHGLVPRQATSGGKRWLAGITKRGSTYM